MVRIGPTAGTGTPTREYGIGATDLCEFMEFPTELLQVCGDSFAGQGVGFGGWFSPVALHVDRASIDSSRRGASTGGVTGIDKPLLADAAPPGASQLPAGVVEINRQNYLLVTTTQELVPVSSRLVKAEAAQGRWQTVKGSSRDDRYLDGGQSQISGYYDPIPTADSPTGWVYIVANNFDRSGTGAPVPGATRGIHRPSKWQGWSSTGRLEQAADAAVGDRVGEMSIRQIDGKAVLSYFNVDTGNMEVRVAADPTGLGTAPSLPWFAPRHGRIRPRRCRTPGTTPRATLRGLHLAGFHTRRGASVRQPVEHDVSRSVALSGDPVRREPVPALVRGCFCDLRPQSVRSDA